MRALASFSLDPKALDLLRAKSGAVSASMSEMLSALILNFLGHASDGEIREMVACHAAATHTPRERLSKREERALAAVRGLLEKYADDPVLKHVRDFSLRQITKASGLYPSEAKQGLRGLETRGLLRCMQFRDLDFQRVDPNTPEVDHWRITTP